MLVFYILSGGKHPFGSSDQECQVNIKQGQSMMGSHLEDTEARDLVNETIKGDVSVRPTTVAISKKVFFLIITSYKDNRESMCVTQDKMS
ncbi:uncharacterized protein TNCV_4384921 [Trichonephila clavipes]|nr:uncharacterized protein TNCV_4384921 [Trichonephila clavipes]